MDLSILDKKDTYSVLLSAIYAANADPKYMLLSDLLYVLDNKNFQKFLAMFEGQTLKIPTLRELTKMLTALMIYAYHDIDGKPMDIVLKDLGVYCPQKSYQGPEEYVKLKKAIKEGKIEVGGLFSDFPSKAATVEP